MLELICISVLGAAYFAAYAKERKEEKLKELKTKVFWYAIRHEMLYNDVVKLIQDHKLTFEEIDKDEEENE